MDDQRTDRDGGGVIAARFSLKMLLASTSMIAVGVFFFVEPFATDKGEGSFPRFILQLVMMFTAAPLIGGAIGLLCSSEMRKGFVKGAKWGLLFYPVAFVIFCVALAWNFTKP
jgi:hypothetical protein